MNGSNLCYTEICYDVLRILLKHRAFNQQALKDFEHFNTQKVADFRSVLVNFVQLQIQLHRKVLKHLVTCACVQVLFSS